MEIILNGKRMEIPEDYTLYDLIEEKKWKLVPNYAKINGKLVDGTGYGKIRLENGQNIRIIPYFGGG